MLFEELTRPLAHPGNTDPPGLDAVANHVANHVAGRDPAARRKN